MKLPIVISLVPDWRKWKTWYCVHALSIAGAIPPAWAVLPKNWQDHAEWMLYILTPLVAISGIIGRLVDQSGSTVQPSEDKP